MTIAATRKKQVAVEPPDGLPETPALQASEVHFSPGGHEVLRGVSLDLRPGAVTIIIGPNGAGKSTLLSVLAGDVPPDSGTVSLGGKPLASWKTLDAARRRAVMAQDTSVSFPYTVREVVQMGRNAWRRTERAAQDETVVDNAISATGIGHLSARSVTLLSGGERQRTALSRVLAQEGSVLLLDEPVSAMDIAHQEQTLQTCRRLAAEGAAVAVVLHDLDAAAAYADWLVLLHHGQVHAAGTVADICRAEVLSEVYGTPIEVFRTQEGGRLRVAPRR
ncbi:heme ABC transporter ATP-binding protein [Arthrobacter luteolus]|uniref:heme ABC transporter ATP-binding protein n=1 Tax=Arthrobacter luteolus TaxID=98672 RepID=UPI0009FA147F|nr:heme ABC transporter ATP-binding protein [Arthrobacter luteolus]